MATVLGLAMKVTADASGLGASLSPVDKALADLGSKAESTASIFDRFRATTEGAANAQANVKSQFDQLAAALKAGEINAKQYASSFAAIQAAAQETSRIFDDGAKTTEKYRTEEDRAAIAVEKLREQLKAKAIDEATYQRALADVTGENERAAKAEQQRAEAAKQAAAELAESEKKRQAILAEGISITARFATEEERIAVQLAKIKSLRDQDAISVETYQRAIAELSGENKRAAQAEQDRADATKKAIAEAAEADRQRQAVLAEGIAVTQRYATAEEKRAAEMARISELREKDAISVETYQRAMAELSGENERAAKAEAEATKMRERASQILEQTRTPLERYDAQVAELRQHLEAGTITQETYDRALTKVSADFQKAEQAAKGYDKEAEKAGKGGVLQFNELSGILSAIPGPIGNIAGRMSGLSSASEGLGRVFAGGLSSGVASLSASVAALANPFTLAIAGVAAFGAAAGAIASGLSSLSGRVEQLQNTAERLGTSFEFVQVLEEAAKRSGASVEQLADGLQKFEVNIAKAREGGNDAAKAFEKLGISQQELLTTDPTELAKQTAEALGTIEDPAERAALAVAVLGKNGLELLPSFKSLGPSKEALERFSAAVSAVDTERLAGVDDSFDDIRTALQGLSQNLLVPFAGLADGVASAIADAIGGFTNLLEPILKRIQPFLDAIGDGFTAAGEVIYDVATTAGSILETLFATIERLGTIVGAAIGSTIGYFTDLLDTFGEFTGISGTVSSVASAIAGAFQGLWQGIKNVVSQVGGFIEKLLKFAEDWLGIDRGVQQANASYEEQRKIVQQTAEESEKKAKAEQEAARKAIEANTKIADSLLEQLEIEQKFGGDTSRFKAAQNVEAVEKEIARVREEVEKARAAGDKDAERAGMQRLQQLDQVQAQQEDIASGATAARKQAEEEQKRIDAEQKKRDEQRQKLLEDNSKKIAEAQKKYAEEVFKLEKKRVEDLRKLRLGALEIGDLRTSSGASTFLDLASGKADPAIDEYRKQRKELEKLNENVRALRMEKAEILGGVG